MRTDEPERRFADGAVLRVEAPRGSAFPRPQPDRRPHPLAPGRRCWSPSPSSTDRNEAEAARGVVLHADIPVDASPEDPDEFYDHQLVGLAAYDVDGTHLGEVTGLVHGGAQDLLAIRRRRPRHARAVRHGAGARGRPRRPGGSWSPTAPAWSRRCPRTERGVRLDDLTIFPDYLAPLALSLPGKAVASGPARPARPRPARLDPRPAPHRRRHARTAAAPGMVMKPGAVGRGPRRAAARRRRPLVVPTPSGDAVPPGAGPRARHARAPGLRLRSLRGHRPAGARPRRRPRRGASRSRLGDYVLNGGEVAALAVTEAVVRLLPGFMGNADSLVEESHEDGLLEYPVYTKPASWRGLDVPAGAALRRPRARSPRWRHEQARAAYGAAPTRPAAGPSAAGADVGGRCPATRGDAGELLTLQRACWLQEALANDSVAGIPALHESLADVEAWIEQLDVVRRAVRAGGSSVPSAAGSRATPWDIGRIMVAPDLQGRGLGRVLLEHIEEVAAAAATSYVLFTGARSARQPADVPARPASGCAPTSRPRRWPWCSPSAADDAPTRADSAGPVGAVADSPLGPVGRGPLRGTHGGSASGPCHRGSLRRRSAALDRTTHDPEHLRFRG